MDIPLITVYITNYNYGKYIKQAIESVLEQSIQRFELFIIDDGSTDDSKSIIESYADHPQITIIYQKNKGLNITNNIALRLSTGKYIMRLDADDYLQSHALESMSNLLEQDDQLGMVFPDYFLVDPERNIIAEVKRHNFNDEVTLLDQPAHGACTMIRTEYLNAVGGYNESFSCQDGYELWIKFSNRFKVSNVKEPLFYYRQHGENLTSNENRILGTRRNINDTYIVNNELSLPTTIGIIPVRKTRLGNVELPFVTLADTPLLDLKIQEALASKVIKKVVITSSEPDIEHYIRTQYPENDRVIFIHRPEELSRYNVSLAGTIQHILADASIIPLQVAATMLLPIEYPFVHSEVIDDAVNTLVIFNSDALISVREEHSTLYQHHGGGMVPILGQEKFTRLEREALFRGVGGIILSRVAAFQKEGKLLSGKVGHISIDQKTAIGIFSGFDLKLAQLILREEAVAKDMV
ncbi:MAG: glycosyltransferase [Saprospiraceae bacterium]